jgi:hypothetical protein
MFSPIDRFVRLRILAVVAAMVVANGATAQVKSDWETEYEKRNRAEDEVKLPAFPSADALIEFRVEGRGDFRFFVDPASISVGGDGIVRYTLVARSGAGVENVSYEGIRCSTREQRVYAFANADKTWRPVTSGWRPAQQRWHYALRREYFCPVDTIIFDAAEGVDALKRGGNRKLDLR